MAVTVTVRESHPVPPASTSTAGSGHRTPRHRHRDRHILQLLVLGGAVTAQTSDNGAHVRIVEGALSGFRGAAEIAELTLHAAEAPQSARPTSQNLRRILRWETSHPRQRRQI